MTDSYLLPCQLRNPEDYFPTRKVSDGGLTEANRNARAECWDCDRQAACLRYATENRMVGIWGGTTTQERRLGLQLVDLIGTETATKAPLTPQHGHGLLGDADTGKRGTGQNRTPR